MRLCEVDGCDRKHAARGMCHLHWARARKTQRPECAIEGCSSPRGGRDWCSAHYQRWSNHGDPLAGKSSPRVARSLDHEDGTRTCLDCSERKALADFPKDRNATRGHRSNCKPCHSARAVAWYAANRDEHLPRQKARYQRDIEKHRARDSARYERDKPKRLELVTAAGHRRRAILLGLPADTGITIRALRKRDGDQCYYCKVTLDFTPASRGREFRPDKATVEHVLPLSRGGFHVRENVALACWQCNVRKNARTYEEWQAPATSRRHAAS